MITFEKGQRKDDVATKSGAFTRRERCRLRGQSAREMHCISHREPEQPEDGASYAWICSRRRW